MTHAYSPRKTFASSLPVSFSSLCKIVVLSSVTDLEIYQPGELIRSRDHKAGSRFMNYADITDTGKRLLQSFHRGYGNQFNLKPSLVLPDNLELSREL